jgi:Apea-like HEPN
LRILSRNSPSDKPGTIQYDSKDELKYRLQIRLARLLGADARQRNELAKDFAKIYGLRSAFVHTGKPGGITGPEVERLQTRAVEILRLATRRFIETDFALGKTPKEMEDVWLDLVLNDR